MARQSRVENLSQISLSLVFQSFSLSTRLSMCDVVVNFIMKWMEQERQTTERKKSIKVNNHDWLLYQDWAQSPLQISFDSDLPSSLCWIYSLEAKKHKNTKTSPLTKRSSQVLVWEINFNWLPMQHDIRRLLWIFICHRSRSRERREIGTKTNPDDEVARTFHDRSKRVSVCVHKKYFNKNCERNSADECN